jgi:hypothetical protein
MRRGLVLFCLAAIGINAMVVAQVDEGGRDRNAWRFFEKGKPHTIYELGEKQWTAERPDGKQPKYAERERTAEYIELQNVDSKLFVRLHAAWSYWRQPKAEQWTRWAKGEWIDGFAPAGKAEKTDNKSDLAAKESASTTCDPSGIFRSRGSPTRTPV